MSLAFDRAFNLLSRFSTHDEATCRAMARQFATEHGRAEAEKGRIGGKMSGTIKAGSATIKDTSGVLLTATPVVRFVVACGILRDAVEKVESAKGSYGFACGVAPRISCPGLAKALPAAPVESASESVPS